MKELIIKWNTLTDVIVTQWVKDYFKDDNPKVLWISPNIFEHNSYLIDIASVFHCYESNMTPEEFFEWHKQTYN